jgi:glycopeptide antibiotics resistance protein
MILLLALAVLTRNIHPKRPFDFTPFWSYRAVLQGGNDALLTQIIANVLAFVPVGLLLGCAFGRMKWWKALAIGGGFSLLIEVLQFVFKRGFAEFDDVFHNMLGCAIGFGLYVGMRWLIRRISPLAGARSK